MRRQEKVPGRTVVTLRTAMLVALSMARGIDPATARDPAPVDEAGRPGSRRIAETVLLHQRADGGWPKNYDREQKLSSEQRSKVLAQKGRSDSTIDNGATHTEIRLLAEAFGTTRDERFKDAALRGVACLLRAQYANGGWPQRFPPPRGYHRHITFNDDAMIGVLTLLRDISGDRERFPFVSPELRARCRKAVERGIGCILRCQILVDGKPAAWCAQHDEVTSEPRWARSYELPSLSGSESVGIVRFLMQIDRPGKPIVRAIDGAVAWLERSRLTGIRQVRVESPTSPGGYDKVVVEDADAPALWARFYDIETNTPIFSSRDGVPRRTLAEISHERRNGYSWLGHYARDLLAQDLPAWRARRGRE